MTMAGKILAFETERLSVYRTTVTSWTEDGGTRTPTDGEPRTLFTACLKGDATQTVVADAVVWDQRHKEQPILFRLYCEWMEVPPGHQPNGFGQELYEGVEREQYDGEHMDAIAVTDAGRALLRKMGRPVDALARHLAPLQTAVDMAVDVKRQQGDDPAVQLFTGIVSNRKL